jgi:sugar phosphate isomerase/epimerase
MKIGIFAKTFTALPALPALTALQREQELVPTVFQTIAGYGIYSVQFNLSCVGVDTLPAQPLSDELVQQIGSAARQAKVELSAISGTFNMAHPDPALRGSNLLKFDVLCEIAAKLRIPVITLCTGTRDPIDMWKWHPDNDSEAAWKDLLRSIQTALIAAEKYNLTLAFEPERENVINSASRARKLLDELSNPRLGIIVDPANLIFAGCNQRQILDEAFAQLSDAITIAHAKDRDPDFNPCAAGKGILDFRYYIQCLKQSGFTGSLILHGLEEKEIPFSRQFLVELLR